LQTFPEEKITSPVSGVPSGQWIARGQIFEPASILARFMVESAHGKISAAFRYCLPWTLHLNMKAIYRGWTQAKSVSFIHPS